MLKLQWTSELSLFKTISIEKAKAEATKALIEANMKQQTEVVVAEGHKQARILQAQGEAAAIELEAKARNNAAEMMADPFARNFAMASVSVDVARGLKANNLTVLASSALGAPVLPLNLSSFSSA